MKLYHSHTRAPHRSRAALFMSLGASLYAACSLDTAPESAPSRATLQAEAESSSLETPSEVADTAPSSAAGAAAPAPEPSASPAAQPSAAVIPAAKPPADEPEPKEPEQKEPEMAAAAKPEPAADKEDKPVDKNGCKPGDYEGVIVGTVSLGPLEVSTLTGTMDLRLVADEDNEKLLRVKQGRVQGVDLNGAVFVADITGEVDCATGELVQSEVERGTYEDTTELIKIGFNGAAEGHYQADPPTLLGTWTISDDSSLIAGQGSWTTVLAERL